MEAAKAGMMAGAILVACAAPALAHHSRAMFDQKNPVTLRGQVVKFHWTNPHVYVELDAVGATGQVERYMLELQSPNMLARVGWRSTMLKTGDKVTTEVWPVRTGEKMALITKITLPDGTSPEIGLVNHQAARQKQAQP